MLEPAPGNVRPILLGKAVRQYGGELLVLLVDLVKVLSRSDCGWKTGGGGRKSPFRPGTVPGIRAEESLGGISF